MSFCLFSSFADGPNPVPDPDLRRVPVCAAAAGAGWVTFLPLSLFLSDDPEAADPGEVFPDGVFFPDGEFLLGTMLSPSWPKISVDSFASFAGLAGSGALPMGVVAACLGGIVGHY